jgi:hypothetical protein
MSGADSARTKSRDQPACAALAVMRLDDRVILSHCEVTSAAARPAFQWAECGHRVAAGAASRTRMQLDVTPVEGPAAAAGAKASDFRLHAAVSRPKGIAIMAVCRADASARLVSLLCDRMLTQFEKMFVERAAALTADMCRVAFTPTLEDAQLRFNEATDETSDDGRIARVHAAVDHARARTLENIDLALERGEKIDTIVEASAGLATAAEQFQDQTRTLRQAMWWRDVKTKMVVAGAVLILTGVIFYSVCGFHCFSTTRK